MDILNLTQHAATAEQVAEGVIEPADKARVQKLLTFTELPSPEEVMARASALAAIAAEGRHLAAMIGGAPYLMGALERALAYRGVAPVYSFSTRVVEETTTPDGAVVKTAVFRHRGFITTVMAPAESL